MGLPLWACHRAGHIITSVVSLPKMCNLDLILRKIRPVLFWGMFCKITGPWVSKMSMSWQTETRKLRIKALASSILGGSETGWLIHSPCAEPRGCSWVYGSREPVRLPYFCLGDLRWLFYLKCPPLGICTSRVWSILLSDVFFGHLSDIWALTLTFPVLLLCYIFSHDTNHHLTYFSSCLSCQSTLIRLGNTTFSAHSDWFRDGQWPTQSVRRNKILLESWGKSMFSFSIGLEPVRLSAWLCWVF